MPRAFLIVLLPLLAAAQEPPLLINTGQPIRVPFACAEEEILAAGLLCTEAEPCAIYLELNAIAPAGKKLFLGGDLHSNSGTIASILLSSDDSGATWKEPTPRIRGAAIEQIQIYDLEHGWAAGETQYPLARDPFFLITTDGGQTWRHKLVSEDGGPGSIQQFWFDSAKHGELIVDQGRAATNGRYATFESQTGGDNWNARSTTPKLPSLKRAPPAGDANFRIRPMDSPSASAKSFEIEKRVGEAKWEPLASFLIEAASCKLKSPEPKEPPPVTETPAAKDDEDAPKPASSVKTTVPPKKGPQN